MLRLFRKDKKEDKMEAVLKLTEKYKNLKTEKDRLEKAWFSIAGKLDTNIEAYTRYGYRTREFRVTSEMLQCGLEEINREIKEIENMIEEV